MKKIIFFTLCIFSALSFAQINQQAQAIAIPIETQPINYSSTIAITEVLPDWNLRLANLPVAQITSDVLLDKVVDYANLTNFNTTEKNLSDFGHFKQSLSELYKASNQLRFISSETLATRTAYSTNENSVDVGIINTLFHRLNFNEENPTLSGVTFTNNQFAIVSGKPTFVAKKIVIASPLKEFVTGSSINFNFSDTFVFNNATTLIKKLIVKFENNTTNLPVTIIDNNAFILTNKNVVYTTSGLKTLEFTTTFTDNTVITTYAQIFVNVVSSGTIMAKGNSSNNSICTDALRERGVFTAIETDNSTSFQGYDESYAFKGKIEYTVFYGNNNTARKMLKPVIIVDGFDPKDKRKVQDCDCENDPKCKVTNSDKTTNYYYPFVTLTYNPGKHTSIVDSMDYEISPTIKNNFLDDLRILGYDVIIVNQPTYDIINPAQPTIQVWVPMRLSPFVAAHWESRPNVRTIDGGADYIERNAYTLASFIKNYVKPLQVSANSIEKLVLFGPSMGGQITRFALAYMEKKFAQTGDVNWKHNARLWVSVDSPHLGANIPVGGQANVGFMALALDKDPAKESYADLNSVAGKQQSILNFEHARTSGTNNLIGSPFFTTYYNNLRNNGVAGSRGYPVSISGTFRKIAMTNGSLLGKKQGVDGQTFLNTKVYLRGLWPFQSSTITLARFRDSFMPSFGSTGQVFKGDGQNFSANIQLFNSSIDVSHPRFTLNVNNQDIRGSLDVVPGGYFKLGKILKESIEGGASEGGFRSETSDYKESNSFISTFSALGHLNPWQNWSNALNTNLLCPYNIQTPFDSYYGEANNTEHTSFTKEGVDWLKKELAGIPQLPTFPVDTNLLVGPDKICLNENNTFGFQDICSMPSAATWSVSGSLQIVNSTENSVTVNASYQSFGTITANFENGQKVSKNIFVGGPYLPRIENYDFDGPPPSQVPYYVNNFPHNSYGLDGITLKTYGMVENPNPNDYEWERETDNFVFSGYNNSSLTIRNGIKTDIRFNNNQIPAQIKFKCRLRNSCGWSDWRHFVFTFPNGWSPPIKYFLMSPNPASMFTNVTLQDPNILPFNIGPITAKMYNSTGLLVATQSVTNYPTGFYTSGMPQGAYIVKITFDNHEETHNIYKL